MVGELGDSLYLSADHLRNYAESLAPVPEEVESIHEQLRTAVRGVAMAREALETIARTAALSQAQLDMANEHISATAEALAGSRITGTTNQELRSLPKFADTVAKSSSEVADTLRLTYGVATSLHRALSDGEPMLVGLYDKTQGRADNLKTWRLGAIRRAHALDGYIESL